MSQLLSHAALTPEQVGYKLFGIGRDAANWSAADLLGPGATPDRGLAEFAWKLASAGYFTEQAGLVAAAQLASETDDAALRFSLATAVSDEARHADAFLAYARWSGGDPAPVQEQIDPLQDLLQSLPFHGKVLVHTVLEGFAADEFWLLARILERDPLGDLLRLIRADEVRHIAIGVNYLARASLEPRHAEEWRYHATGWLESASAITGVDAMASALAAHLGIDRQRVHDWLIRRHETRLRAAGILESRGR